MARMPDFEPPEPEPEPSDDPDALEQPASETSADANSDAGSDRPDAGRHPRALWPRVRVPLLAFASGVVVAVAATVAMGAAEDRSKHDEVVVALDAYVAAVESGGDRTAATAATPALDEAVASSELLAAVVPIAEAPDVVCDEPRVGADLALVDCRVRVDARREPATIALEHDGLGWFVARGLEVPVRIRSGVLRVDAIGGAPIDEATARGDRPIWMLPGRYDVEARTPAEIVVDRLDGLVVSASRGSVRWTSDTSDTVDADVRDAALAYVDACAATPADGCPAIRPRDPIERFETFAVVGHAADDDPFALTYDVSVRRPVGQPTEFLLVTVRVDFGDDLDRYDVAVVPS